MKVDNLYLAVIYHFFSVYDPELVDSDDIAERIDSSAWDQGFTWWTNHVDFYTVNPDVFGYTEYYDICRIDVEVVLDELVALNPNAVRAIQVPFSVVGNKGIFITDGMEDSNVPLKEIAIPQGDYALVFEQGWKYNPQPIERNQKTGEIEVEIRYTLWGRLWFNQQDRPAEPKILLHDPRDTSLRPTYPLRMDGVPT